MHLQQTGAGGIKPEPVVQVTHSSEEGGDWKHELMELAKVCHVEIIVSLAKVGIGFIPRPHLEKLGRDAYYIAMSKGIQSITQSHVTGYTRW